MPLSTCIKWRIASEPHFFDERRPDALLVRCPTWPIAAQVEVALLSGSAPTSWPIVRTKLTNSEAKCQVFWP